MASASRSSKPSFNFYLSCDVNLQVRVAISHLQGTLPCFAPACGGGGGGGVRAPAAPASSAALHVVAELTSGGDALTLEAHTTYVNACPEGASFGGQTLTFCVKYRDLPHDALLVLSLVEVVEGVSPCVAGVACLPLFNTKGRLKAGPRRLAVRPPANDTGAATAAASAAPDGGAACSGDDAVSSLASASSEPVPSSAPLGTGQASTSACAANGSLPAKPALCERGRRARLEHLVRLYNRGDMPRIDWLDPLTARRIAEAENGGGGGGGDALLAPQRASHAWHDGPVVPMELVVDLPSFPHAVLYYQPMSAAGAASLPSGAPTSAGAGASSSAQAAAHAAGGRRVDAERLGGGGPEGSWTLALLDPEVGRDNPAELKSQKLERTLTRGTIDRDLKPNSDERRRITAVLKLPPNRALHADERSLLWRFRYSLTQETRALTKFLKCVDWSDAMEAKQAADLMREWVTIEVADALELLSPDFLNPEVRAHAVSVLRTKDDDELLYYLLQLVQALRYERADRSPSAEFLIERARANPHVAVMLHWYLFTEVDDPVFGPRASAIYALLVSALQVDPACAVVWEGIRRQQEMLGQLTWVSKELKASKVRAARATQRLHEVISESGPLSELLTLRVPLPLSPDILLMGLVPQECMCFKSAMLPLRLSFAVSPQPVQWQQQPQPQAAGMGASFSGRQHDMFFGSPRTSATFHHGHHHGSSSGSGGGGGGGGAAGGHGFGYAEGGSVGAGLSALEAGGHGSEVSTGSTGIVQQGEQVRCVIIYKKGDDLRQDQFILQMISLMDRLLKRENLDLRLTPYKVLPTSGDDGLVEFVPSTPLSKVLSTHRTIHRYLSQWQADPGGPFGLKAEALETFVRSCAGYCVATYVLGVGDRHLDNLMLTADGRLFHIDFGYILGNDPKPFPPPMKICKEMVEAMGGQGSEYYVQFRMYCCEAYNILRKSADLILSLFHLMAGASIETIRADPEKAILKLQEKFRLDFTDEQAVEYMQMLINESATALMPQIVETTHRWAQYWR